MISSSIPGYNLIKISEVWLKGLIYNVNLQENLDTGTLKHNTWVYWGHSRALLAYIMTKGLLALHSSWEDSMVIWYGVLLVAIQAFLCLQFPTARDTASVEEEVEVEIGNIVT
ncbi:hypothetical protein BJX76DRAFT_325759 [Aspergillus varians]